MPVPVLRDDASGPRSGRALAFEDLYPNAKATMPAAHRARHLLREATEYADAAQKSIAHNETPIATDEHLTRLLALLPELFCLEISDVFSMLISAVHCSLTNDDVVGLDLNKVWAISQALSSLYHSPFLNEPRALDLIEAMQDAGLQTTPAVLTNLVTQIVDESIS
jgi:hypothetical protein